MKNKLIITTSAALVILISIALYISNNAVIDNSDSLNTNETSQFYDPDPQPTVNPEEIVTLLIDFGEQGTFDYQTDYTEGVTALEILQEGAQERDVVLETIEYDFGTIVDSIDGMENTTELSWIYFINGESANVGADSYELKPGDVIEWRYIEPEY